MNAALRLVALLAVLCLAHGALAGDTSEVAVHHNERGLTLTAEGRHLEAVEAFRRALDAAPTDAVIVRNLALARSNLAVELLGAGDVENATHHAEEALKLQGDDPVIVLNLAACRDEQGFPDRAAVLVRRAREMAPENGLVRSRMGAVLYREGHLAEAIVEWREAVRLDPEDTRLAERLGRARGAARIEATLSPQISGNFIVLHDSESSVIASLVLRELEETRRVVAADAQEQPSEPVRVVLLSSEQFRDATGANAWVAGLFDGRIRLPVKGVRDHDALLARARHEYVHAVLAPLGKRAPSWLHEGLAQVHEGRSIEVARERAGRSRPLAFDALTASFASTRAESAARLQYDTALAFTADLRAGENAARFRLALRRLFEGATLAAAFEDAYGAELPALYEAFQKRLRG